MHAEGIEGIVVFEDRLELRDGEVGDDGGDDADDHGAGRVDEAGGGSDDHESGDDARAEAEDGGVAAEGHFDEAPDEAGDGGGDGGCHERIGGDAVGGEGAAGVESIPADPEHAGADHTENHAVRRHLLFAKAEAGAEDEAEHECGPAGGHVDDGAAGEVDGGDGGVGIPDAVHEAGGAPDHVGEREVDDDHPEPDEQEDGAELHAFGDGAEDQRGGDDREHHLVHRKDVVRNPVGVVGVGRGADALEKQEFEAADEGAAGAFAEDEAVAKRPP